MSRSLLNLILVNFKTFFREPAILFWAVFFPIILAWVLGVAFSNKGESLRTVYVTGDSAVPGKLTGEKILGQETGNVYRIRFQKASEPEAIRAVKRGLITLFIEVRVDSVIYHFDPLNSDAQLTHLLVERSFADVNTGNAIEPMQATGTRYVDFLIPGMIALGIMNSCIWGIGWSLVESRMKKLLRRIVATPLHKTVFFSSQMITRIILGIFEIGLLILFSYFFFGIRITGSIPALFIVFLAGVFAFAGIAILMASRTSNTEVANGLVNAVTLPMMILSGVFFNYHNFPDWAIPIIQALPLTLVADSIRSIFIEGAGLLEVLRPVLILCTIGLVAFTAGLRIFKWY